MIKADTHLFGSRAGYQTLARSPGINDSEASELSVLGFGQSNDPAFLASLKNDPCVYGRALKSGRYAITRVFSGNADDAGRATLEFRSVIIRAADAETIMSGESDYVINDATLWDDAAFGNGGTVTLAPPPPSQRTVEKEDIILFDAWIGSMSGTTLAVAPSEAKDAIVRLPQVLAKADRLKYRWGVRMLSGSAPVDVCTLSPSASRSGRRRVAVITLAAHEQSTTAARTFPQSAAVGSRQLPASAAMLRQSFESSARRSNEDSEVTRPVARPSRMGRLMLAASMFMVVIAAIGWLLFRNRQADPVHSVASDIASNVDLRDNAVGSEQETETPRPASAPASQQSVETISTTVPDESPLNSAPPKPALEPKDDDTNNTPPGNQFDGPSRPAHDMEKLPTPAIPQESLEGPPLAANGSFESALSNIQNDLPSPTHITWFDRLEIRVKELKLVTGELDQKEALLRDKRSRSIDTSEDQKAVDRDRATVKASLTALQTHLAAAYEVLDAELHKERLRYLTDGTDDEDELREICVKYDNHLRYVDALYYAGAMIKRERLELPEVRPNGKEKTRFEKAVLDDQETLESQKSRATLRLQNLKKKPSGSPP